MRDGFAFFFPILLFLNACGSDARNQPAQAPKTISIVPSSGHGSRQVFTLIASSPGGLDGVKTVRLLINQEVDGRNACYVVYTPADRSFALVNDTGEGVLPLTAGTAANRQCTLAGRESAASAEGNSLKLTLSLTFSPVFAGPRRLYGYIEDHTGAAAEFQNLGSWVVTP